MANGTKMTQATLLMASGRLLELMEFNKGAAGQPIMDIWMSETSGCRARPATMVPMHHQALTSL